MASSFDRCATACFEAIKNTNELEQALNQFAQDKTVEFFGITTIVDYALRKVLEKKFVPKIFESQSLKETGVFEFLEIVATLPLTLMDAAVPFALLGETFETCTVVQIGELFQYLEQDNNLCKHMTSTLVTDSNACYLSLLSTCKKVLRRLSKTDNTELCGRILSYMAKIFPLNQRSALNVTGEINRSHATVIDTEEEDEKTVLIDMDLYKRFWSLQSFFQNPQQVMGESWNEFIGVVDETLKTFDTEEALGDSQDQSDDATFVPKYLTSRKLLHLQFKDAKFRRQIMLQMLIVFQNFEITSQRTVKKLTEQQLQRITQLRTKIMQILQKISNQHFLDTISSVLERERFWLEWKNDRCPPETFVSKTKDIEEQKLKLTAKTKDLLNRRKHQQAVGEPRFVQIFENNTQDDIEKFLQSEDPTVNKCQIPTYQQYVVDKVTEEADPEAGIEDEYKVVKNPVFMWKALRLMCRSRLHSATLESKYDIEGIIIPKKKEAEPEPEPITPVPQPAADNEQAPSSQPEEADTESVKPDTVMDESSQEPPQPSPSPDVKKERASPERNSPKHDQHERSHDSRNGGDRDNHTNKRRRLNNSSREDTSRDDDHRGGGRHHDHQRKRSHPEDDNDHPPRGGRQPRNRKR